MSTPHVTVIIPVYNDQAGLDVCLRHLAAQDYPQEHFDVIVVDNGSTVPMQLTSPRPRNTQILVETQRGSYAARNAALAETTSEVIAFTDGDCAPAPDWLSEGVDVLSSSPTVGLVAGRIDTVLPAGRPARSVELFEHVHAFPQDRYAEESHFGATANVFTRKQVIADAGDFDASLQSGGDREWGNRVHAAGWKVVYGPKVVVAHPPRQTWGQHWRKLVRVHEGERDRRLRSGQAPGSMLKLKVQDVVPPLKTIRRVSADPAYDWSKETTAKYAAGATLSRWAGLAARWKVGVTAVLREHATPQPLRSGKVQRHQATGHSQQTPRSQEAERSAAPADGDVNSTSDTSSPGTKPEGSKPSLPEDSSSQVNLNHD